MKEAPKVKVRCPVCKSVTYKDSVEALLLEVEKLWEPWQEYLTEGQRKRIQEMNRGEKLEKILAEKGEIALFCPVCQFTATQVVLEKTKGEKMSWEIL